MGSLKDIWKFLALFLLFATHLNSQNLIQGQLLDARTGEPLIGANVIENGNAANGTVTDFDGYFELKVGKIPTSLNFSYVGYTAMDYNIDSADKNIKAKLSEDAVTIDLGVEIKGQRVSEKQKAAPLTIESLDAIAIKQTASTDFYNGLGALKGVDLTTASMGFTVINMRGFNSTSPVRSLQTIDGVDNQSPGLNFSLGNFLGASELDIQKVDLVVGASSAFYGPNAFNGVIAMETKNPFFSKGLAASVKVGERDLVETAIRFADIFKNKKGQPVVAYKTNFSYLSANDWVANNYDPITDAPGNGLFSSVNNPGGFDAVNIYGDEYERIFNSTDFNRTSGLNTFNRRGYREEDVVDYDTRNIKAGAAVHIRTQPSKDFDSPELILGSNFGYGTTVYQGDNRFSLRGIQFFQHKIEFRKKDKYFIRAYATHEDAGDSYDPYFTAQKMVEASASNEVWERAYEDYWIQNKIFDQMKNLGMTPENMGEWQEQNKNLLEDWHAQAQNFASSQNRFFGINQFYEPGTPRFDSLFNDITSRKNNEIENGTRFFDRSALYHAHGEYKFDTDFFKELVVGGNVRLYRPNSEGTIFSDDTVRITNSELGFYTGATKQFGDFTASAAARVDKNQNFDALFSPAASLVYKPSDNHYLRFSFSSAIRNPTLSDQYLNLTVGPARLLGNLNGFENLVTLQSFQDFRFDPRTPFNIINVAPIRPERVRTIEMGYRATLFEKLFLDMSFYNNWYRDFIGFQIGLEIPVIEIELFPGGPTTEIRDFSNISAVRVSANSDLLVTSRGFALGANYYFGKYYSFNGNYSFNELVTQESDDIVPAFNTPRHKYNVGISGRDIPLFKNSSGGMGFNVNYKWIEGFIFEGSPQFTGFIPTYDLVDLQVNYSFPKAHLTVKAGASNALDNRRFQTYGGPRIGRMAYLTITYDFKAKI